ncbi:ataxin-7-like protein 3 [Phymastichus coffea]|uniref:ataxin-7-like protein 3 n=1 Tax=Phymastichus coffea TaxID=108790 RepID=UPI00273C864C|nr:ataxin-7-like protein 3 [Phymastichus coffea]
MSVTDDRIRELNCSFLEFMNKPENVETATKEIYDDLLDEVLMGFVFDVHRVVKIGSSEVEEGIPDDESYAIVDSPGLDVFGQHPIKKSQECNCPNCERGVAASRFATHLEKCMGMGRNSSRIASRRIANNSKDLTTFSGVISDDDDDVDWSVNNDKRKRRKERNGLKKLKQPRQQQAAGAGALLAGALLAGPASSNNSSGSSSSSSLGGPKNSGSDGGELVYTSSESSPSNYEGMSLEEKRVLLQQVCGVMSEHTKKICTRSMRCPQHSDEQRKEVRAGLEELVAAQGLPAGLHGVELEPTAYDEAAELAARWDRDSGAAADALAGAASSSSSSGSRKREAKAKGKAKAAGKRERNSPVSSHYIFLNT